MKMSCNGCRVLRKGCTDDCIIRPCLSWLKNPDAQANATVFLAKFYGRAGLLNLVTAGPDNLRPAIFRSLLYEACGRIVNPIYGSVGLLWSGNWYLCQAAVEAVLKGEPVSTIPTEAAAALPVPPMKSFDIRHVNKAADDCSNNFSDELHRIAGKGKTRFKHVGAKVTAELMGQYAAMVNFQRAWSHESSAESLFSAEAGSHVSQAEPVGSGSTVPEVELELTLGLEPARPAKGKAPVNG